MVLQKNLEEHDIYLHNGVAIKDMITELVELSDEVIKIIDEHCIFQQKWQTDTTCKVSQK